MAVFYITGAPGSGKTTLQKELHRRGYVAFDIDNPRFGGPYNKSSGKRVVIPPAEKRSPDWFEAHEWRVSLDGIEALKNEANDKMIFLCGVAASDGQALHLFDKILYLQLDEATLKRRLGARTDNDYGKNDFELREIMERKRGLDAKYAALGVTTIDANKPLDEVVDEVLRCVT